MGLAILLAACSPMLVVIITLGLPAGTLVDGLSCHTKSFVFPGAVAGLLELCQPHAVTSLSSATHKTECFACKVYPSPPSWFSGRLAAFLLDGRIEVQMG